MQYYHEILFYYPYEYKTLEKHFCDMAARGWKIKTMRGSWLVNYHTYEKCEPSVVDYYVDFVEDNNRVFLGYDEDKSERYRSLIEEYGYQYVTGGKELLVFEQTGEESIETRVSGKDTKKAIRRATWKNFASYFIMYLLYVFILLTGLRLDSYSASSNMTLFSYCGRLVLIAAMTLLLAAPLLWMVYDRRKGHIWMMKLRIFCLYFGVIIFFTSMFMSDDSLAVAAFFISGALVVALWHMLWWRFTKITSKVICALVIVAAVTGCLLFTQRMKLPPVRSRSDLPIDNEVFHIEAGTRASVEYSTSVLMTSVSVYYDEEILNKGMIFYELMIVKDSFFKEYLLKHIPYEYAGGDVGITKRNAYTIYQRKYNVFIRKGEVLLKLDNELYQTLRDDDLDAMFEDIADYRSYNV